MDLKFYFLWLLLFLLIRIDGIPVIEETYVMKNNYMYNETAVLSCYAVASSNITIHWYFGKDQFIGNEDTSRDDKGFFRKNSTVKWRVEKSANIECIACTEESEGCSKKIFKITLIDAPDGFGIIRNGNITTVGDTFEASCLASTSEYQNVDWYDENDTKIVSNNNIFIKKSATVLIHRSDLKIASVPNIKTLSYTCKSEMIKNNTINKVDLNVTIHDQLAPFFVHTNMYNKTDEYDPGTVGSIVLDCHARGYPVPSLTWLLNDKKIRITNNTCGYNFDDSNQVLTIKYLHKECTGNYTCSVQNRIGERRTFQIIKFQNRDDGMLEKGTIVFLIISLLIFGMLIQGVLVMIESTRNNIEQSKRLQSIDAVTSQFSNHQLSEVKPQLTITDQMKCLPYDERFEFPSDQLKFGKILGSGAFGVVQQAEANGILDDEDRTTVAVKMVKQTSDPSHLIALSNELKIMIHLGKHINIVNLLGACTKNFANGELYVIVEFCRYGSLLDYLQNNKNKFINQIDNGGNINCSTGRLKDNETKKCTSPLRNDSVRRYRKPDDKKKHLQLLCTDDLIFWSFQIAGGMEFLSQRKVLHADLAARNLLLSHGNIVKICDFGLAKNIDKNGIYQKTSSTRLPVKWMAPESLNNLIFSNQSDVWSFGIVLWELFTLGQTPYSDMDWRTIRYQLTEGYRLAKPQYSTEEIYEIMICCWNEMPRDRPTFSQLVERISLLIEKEKLLHHLTLNMPFVEANKSLFEHGRRDYLSLMTAPDYDVVSSLGSNSLPETDKKKHSSNYNIDKLIGTKKKKQKRNDITEETPMIHLGAKNQFLRFKNHNYVEAD